jgi:branched-chain amino acid transport system substrate-binding protein
MTAALKAQGLKPKIVEFFNVDDKDFVTHLKKIEDSGAEVILLAANPGEAKEIIKTLITRPKKLPIVAHWGFTGGSFGRDLATELQSVDLKFLQTVAFLGNKRPLADKIAKAYLTTYGGDSVADIDAAAGVARSYDAMRLVALALKAADKNPKLTLISAMEGITAFEGVVTSYKYPFKGQREGLDASSYRLGRYDEKGRIVPADGKK